VSQLYEMKLKVEQKITSDGLNANDVLGQLGLKSGMLLALINANSPDVPEKIARFKQAAKEVLNLSF
jgi:hypothetical protein